MTYNFVLGKKVVLNNGQSLPVVGLSTFYMNMEGVVHEVIDHALDIGYRLFDTSTSNCNEMALRNAFAELLPKHHLERSNLFIISKLVTVMPGPYGGIRNALFQTLSNMGLDYVDLFVICSSVESSINLVHAWEVMQSLQREGYATSVGVANFSADQLRLITADLPMPTVNQVEYHPLRRIDEVYSYCKQNNIHIQAYSPFGEPLSRDKRLFSNRFLKQLAAKYEVPVPQMILMWLLQKDVAVLPATRNPAHLMENLDFELRLTRRDMHRIDQMAPALKESDNED